MKPHALSHRAAGVTLLRRRAGVDVLRFIVDRFLLLPIGAAIALIWANTAGESYFRFSYALAFPVNEIGMALFLALIAQETFEAVMPGGSLHTWRRWGMSLIAAAGGILGAAFVYLGYVYAKEERVLAQAWPIAASIDIAAGYYVLKLIYRRSSAIAFLVLLAGATDAAGLLLLAVWTPFTAYHLVGAALLVVAIGTAALFRHSKVRAFWPYMALCGAVSWWGFYLAGVHPALALVPIVPFLPHEPRPTDPFTDVADDDAVHHAEHEWNEAVQVTLFLFGLVNGGVLLRGYDTGTWAVLSAALIGRPLGIVLAVGLALAAGFHLPRRIGWRDLVIVACATSSGFTLALFFAGAFLPLGAVLQQIKFGALATAAGALVALGAARLLNVGRFRSFRRV